MIHIKNVLDRVTPLGAAGALLLSAAIPAVSLVRSASAAPLTQRSLMVSSTNASNDLLAPDGTTYSGLTAGDPRNGQKVSHIYTFTPATSGDVEGLTIEYCETAFGFMGGGACTATNLLAGGAGTSFSASAWGGKTISIGGETYNITANSPNHLTLVAASTPATFSAGVPVTINFAATAGNYFVNPNSSYKSTSNGTYFAHIATFSDGTQAGNAYGDSGNVPPGIVDDGTVTNNITESIGIYTRVQETLNFSVEGEQTAIPNGPSVDPGSTCAPLAESGQIKMGDTNHALATGHAYDAYSYFRLSTNSSSGVTVSYSGDTLKTGGGLDINPLTPAPSSITSAPGTEQFGLAIDNTATGTYPVNVGNGGALTVAADYTDGDGLAGLQSEVGPFVAKFAFKTASVTTPEVIASTLSPNGVVNCDTGAVRYIANISPDTPAGIYQTKINYIASPKY